MPNRYGRKWQGADLRVASELRRHSFLVMMCPFGQCGEKFGNETAYQKHVATHAHKTQKVKRDWNPPWQNIRRT